MVFALVADGALQLVLDRRVCSLAERWVPQRLGEPRAGAAPARAVIEVVPCVRAERVPRVPKQPATLTLDGVSAWVDERRAAVLLRGAAPSSGGVLSFASSRARLRAGPGSEADLYSMLTVSAGLLLAGLGRALMHAGAVVAPDGGAWLLAGDARSGKSTTCATLALGGWGYLSDDQVVLRPTERGVEVEGWLRPFHLAAGEGRREVDPVELGLAGWRRTAPLAGIIFPVVEARQPTRLAPVSAATALGGLVRQSPWLLASRRTAPDVLALLARAAAGRAFSLRLGLDTFHNPVRLEACLGPLGSSPARSVRS